MELLGNKGALRQLLEGTGLSTPGMTLNGSLEEKIQHEKQELKSTIMPSQRSPSKAISKRRVRSGS